jgi:hypothetical protein
MSAMAAAFAGSSRGGDRINAAARCDTLELAKTCCTMFTMCGAAENVEMEGIDVVEEKSRSQTAGVEQRS